jgi:hypothetical protein
VCGVTVLPFLSSCLLFVNGERASLGTTLTGHDRQPRTIVNLIDCEKADQG